MNQECDYEYNNWRQEKARRDEKLRRLLAKGCTMAQALKRLDRK